MDMSTYQTTGGDYFKAAELGDQVLTLTVQDVTETSSNGMDAVKPLLVFDETDQQLVLNKTNLGILVDAWGIDSDDWIGKRLKLGTVTVTYQGKQVPGLRVSPAIGKAAAKGSKAKATAPADDDIPF